MTMEKDHPENMLEMPLSQDGLVDLLVEAWESQERGRLVDLPRWAQ